MKYLVPLLPVLLIIAGCNLDDEETPEDIRGDWRGSLETKGGELPINFSVIFRKDTLHRIDFVNAEEVIPVKDVKLVNDTVYIQFPIFETRFVAHVEDHKTMNGWWYDDSRGEDYRVPFHAEKGPKYRFVEASNGADVDVSGIWKTVFSPQKAKSDTLLGKFDQQGNLVFGTFLSTIGDFRFLSGAVIADSFFLSTFDGAHAYLFKATVHGDSISGMYYSGIHHEEPWVATRNKYFNLPDPESVTYLKEGYDSFYFSFPNLDSNIVSLNDEQYEGNVVIIQLMGSWCPNCKDETEFLVDYLEKNPEKDLEIIALAYERTRDFDEAVENLRRMKDHYNIDYEILYAGYADKAEASESLPMLNEVKAWPTTIFLDKEGQIRKIHTGFSGPATGDEYTTFKNDFKAMVEELLNE